MPFTHRVRRPWSGVKSGDLVDASTFRNLTALERQHYIEPLSEKERAEMATHGPTDHVDGSNDEPRIAPARTDMTQPPPAQIQPVEQPAVEATRAAVGAPPPAGQREHPLTHHPDDQPAKPKGGDPDSHPATHHPDDNPAAPRPTPPKHPDDRPARVPNTEGPGQNQQPPRGGPAVQSDPGAEPDAPHPPASPRGPYRRRQIPE